MNDYRALLSGSSWYEEDTVGRPVFLTYSFSAAPPAYFAAIEPGAAATFSPLSEWEKTIVRSALKAWGDASGVQFFETAQNQGDLTFGFYDFDNLNGGNSSGSVGQGYYPSSFAYDNGNGFRAYSGDNLVGGDVQFDSDYRATSFFAGDFAHVATHEVGHALGLKHPFETSGTHQETLTSGMDNGNQTVMSYSGARNAHLGPLDVAAIQHIYGGPGADGTHLASWNWNAATETLTQTGSSLAEMLRGTGANDIIYSAGGKDVIYTAQGRDVVHLVGQAASVNGGEGLDTVYTGINGFNRSAVTRSGDTAWVRVGDGFQELGGVERLDFGTSILALDVDQGENAGNAYRIYRAAFDRNPDQQGLSFWTKWLDDGDTDPLNMAARFIDSNEFRALYGSSTPANGDFLVKIYANVLDRAPDQGGYDWWLDKLNTRTFGQAEVLARFSDSTENRANVHPDIQNGVVLSEEYHLF